jgi:hypothetical protein
VGPGRAVDSVEPAVELVVAVEPVEEDSAVSSGAVSQAATKRIAAKRLKNFKRIFCPLKTSPELGEGYGQLIPVILAVRFVEVPR